LTEFIGNACAEAKLTVYSGGARGVDKTAMGSAIAAGGTAAGLLADSLEKAIRAADARMHIEEGQLALATPYSPHASFKRGNGDGAQQVDLRVVGLRDGDRERRGERRHLGGR